MQYVPQRTLEEIILQKHILKSVYATNDVCPQEKEIPTCTLSVFSFGFRCSSIVAGRKAPTSSWVAQKPFLLEDGVI